ncbi:hypothetical protein RKD26_000028 [Streptomyces calvus]
MVKLSFGVVAGASALVALVAYRRQSDCPELGCPRFRNAQGA